MSKKLDAWLDQISDFGRDAKLNLSSLVTDTGTPGLTPEQRAGIAQAVAYALKHFELAALLEDALPATSETKTAAKGAAVLMAMNNVYYRTLHLAEDPELTTLPARLRMNLIAKPGVPKIDFELMCLAVSAMSGCGMCIKSHSHELKKAGVTIEGIQSAIRLASVIQSASMAHAISG